MECYKDFAHIYDSLINEDVDYRRWAKIILNICDEMNIERQEYLDLACGTGNITKEIGRYFKHIWGVDLSSDMLMEAQDKLRKDGIKAKFVCQDLSELDLNRKFDLITCCLDSTNYLVEKKKLENYFYKVYNTLKDNGLFVFDINSYYKLTQVLGNNIFTYDSDDVFYSWENVLEDDIVNMYLTFFIKNGQVYERFDEYHRERAYKQEYIEKLLKKIGFDIVCKLNNYETKHISENTERIVYIIKK
ncbi:class I SAM-dependent DNA methyltransferase [Haloimpatiens sp. FM7330]|uniref:class I SAM-dependent DNA methyltransferase n=1 Tax=Haloimpatiens sp. FM7330 TaxID=3298610 RepID=UPI0036310BC4